MTLGNIHIGTSGWHYAHWVGPFYPADLSPAGYLAWYAARFASVEINNTFYRIPTADTVAHWRAATPAGFVFACKASRYITHMKKLKDPVRSTARFFQAVERLGDRLGPVLFQLPAHWGCDLVRLSAFLEALPARFRYALEFRDPQWFDARVYRLLERHGVALCAYDLFGWRSPVRVTADLVYVRLHGPEAAYGGDYDGRTLYGWARRLEHWRREGLEVHCYFNNDRGGCAVSNAWRVQEMVNG